MAFDNDWKKEFDQRTGRLEPKRGLPPVRSEPLLDDAVWCLAHVWSEMNTIRARDGVPRMFDGSRSSVSQEWWDELMDRCESVIVKHTGKPAHCNPVLYTSNAEREVRT